VVVDVNGWTKGSFGGGLVASTLGCAFTEFIKRKAVWWHDASLIKSQVIFLIKYKL
jgi:hypothetical protein